MLTSNRLSRTTNTIPSSPTTNRNFTVLLQKEAEAATAISIYNSSFSHILPKCIGDHGKIITINNQEHLKHLIINEGFSLKLMASSNSYYLSRGLEGGGLLEEIALKLETKPHGQKSVFISYCHAQKEVAIAIEAEFNAKGYFVIRDENILSSGTNLNKFMKLINHTKMDYVVPIISSNYLKSNNCMREVIEMRSRYNKKTILPCIIDSGPSNGTSIFTSDGKNNILKHWQDELLKAEQAKNFGDQTLMRSITADLPLFLKDLSKHLYTTSSQLQLEKYQGLFELIEKVEAEKVGSTLGTTRRLLDNAAYQLKIENYPKAEEIYKKATEELEESEDKTSVTSIQLNAIAYGGYAECLKYRNSPEHSKFLRIAKNFGHTAATDKPIEIDINKLMTAIKRAQENSDISFLVTMLPTFPRSFIKFHTFHQYCLQVI